MPWYTYQGSGDPSLPGNYYIFIPFGSNTAPSCTTGGYLCAIFTDGGDYPYTISQNIRNYTTKGLADYTPQPNMPPRLYVRMKRTA